VTQNVRVDFPPDGFEACAADDPLDLADCDRPGFRRICKGELSGMNRPAPPDKDPHLFHRPDGSFRQWHKPGAALFGDYRIDLQSPFRRSFEKEITDSKSAYFTDSQARVEHQQSDQVVSLRLPSLTVLSSFYDECLE